MHTKYKTIRVLNLTCDAAVITIKQQHCTQIRIYYRPDSLISDPFLLNKEHVGADLAAVLLRRGGGPCGGFLGGSADITSCKHVQSMHYGKKDEVTGQTLSTTSQLHNLGIWLHFGYILSTSDIWLIDQLIDCWLVICAVRFCSMTLLCLHPTPTGRLSPCPCW